MNEMRGKKLIKTIPFTPDMDAGLQLIARRKVYENLLEMLVDQMAQDIPESAEGWEIIHEKIAKEIEDYNDDTDAATVNWRKKAVEVFR